MFPFSHSGTLKIATTQEIRPEAVIARLENGLQLLKARDITIGDRRIAFYGGVLRLVLSTNLLVPISYGEINIDSGERVVTAAYRIRFTGLLLSATIGIFGFLGPFVWQAPNLGYVGKVGILLLGWAWLFGANYINATQRFPRFIREAVASLARSNIAK